MRTLSFLFFLVLCGATCLYAQKLGSKTQIQGVAVDSVTGKPLRTASVSLLTARDSAYVTATITDGDGRFQIRNVAPGQYRVLVTFVGYRNGSRTVTVTPDSPTVDAGTFLMTEQAKTLGEVVVTQERPPITVKQDTLEFNASSFKTQPNAQVEELLKKLPGVEVSRDGTIRAQGQTVNRVLVDGKPFFGNDPKMATRNLPADIVDRVQLYDQSSDQSQFSGIDDGNRERTINLTIKRDKRKGYFGQNSAGAGTDGRYQGRLNVNRFNNGRQISLTGQANNLNQQGFTLQDGPGGGGQEPVFVGRPGGGGNPFGNQSPTNIIETKAAGINYRDKWGKNAEVATSYFFNQAITTTDQQSRRESILPGQSLLTDQSNFSRNRVNNHRLNLRLDWKLDSETSLRFTPNVSWQNSGFDSRSVSRSTLPDGQLLNEGDTRYGSAGNGLNVYSNLLLMRKFRREGRTLSLNLNTIVNNQLTNALNQSINTFYDSTGGNPRPLRLDQRNRQDNYAPQNALTLSYTEPLSLTRKLELRYAYGTNRNQAERDVADFNETTGQYDRRNLNLSNQFTSSFNTHRLGGTIQTRRLRYTYALGFDLQQAELRAENRSVDTSLNRQYFHILPNALFNYTFSGNRSLRLQYRTRLNAPSVTQLQPIVDNTNPLNIRLGNPALQPEFYNTITLTYNGSSGLGTKSLFLFAAVNQSDNRIATATTVNAAGAQTTQPVNIGGYWAANGFLSVGRTIQSVKLNINLNTNGSFSRALSLINNQTNESQNITIGQGVRLESNFNGKVDYGLSGNVSYQTATYSLLPRQNTAFWSQYVTADLNWQLPFKFILRSDLTYTATSGRSAGFNQRYTLWNASLARQFFKGKQGEMRLQVFDLLNQNRSLVRNTADTYVEDVQSRVLRQYFLVSFVYNLRKFGV
ncbi:hypothetical protein BN8_01568 [Fibrisoma limi BUZ 3]|uniref:Outer membrane protein beta-barrel domain-containing protein n=1 Tax=Fibrisoma limi BUZ 3 TaxID=1185876 RepID=I2GF82_9BACT|nr:TonB-dependent receptor [Fibrisoma limi]CCH52557.1 hypothetical protein BN8_01568 [Fibrisoma limi BUZ 3]